MSTDSSNDIAYDRRRIHSPATYLEEANKLFGCMVKRRDPLWRKRLPAWVTRFDRAIVIELLPNFVLRVRDPRNGQILAESEPGNIGVLKGECQPDGAPHTEVTK